MEYQIVAIGKLRPDPDQPRRHIDLEALKEMATSIKNEGVVNAIEVDADFIIVTGERRWRASKIAGLKEVPVKILDKITAHGRFIRQVQENIHQNTMAPLDTAEALDKIRKWIVANPTAQLARDEFHGAEHFQKGVKELEELLGIPKSTISRYLALLGVSAELREALKTPKFQMSKIDTIKEAPEKYQKKLGHVVATQTSIPRDTVRHIATALRRADKYEEDGNAEQLLGENFEGLSVVGAIGKINKIVPDEMSRIKEPADIVKFTAEKAMELMDILEDHPLAGLDDFHRPLQARKLTALGFYLQNYLQGKDTKLGKPKALAAAEPLDL